MSDIKVSIVLISKNVVKYVKECLESVVDQTLKDIEIICVDAFSEDGTREIIQEYAKKDNRIMLLDDDKGSCGYSYNKGIKHAKGKYIGFVETDDYVRQDMFEILYNTAEKYSLEFVKGNHVPFINVRDDLRMYDEERIFADQALNLKYNEIIDPSVHPDILWPDHCMWNGIYLRSFLLENDIVLNESKGPSYQDHGFQWKTITQAKRAMYMDEGLYYYRKDNEGSSMKNPKGMIKDYAEFLFVKEFLKKCSGIMPEHWWVYYQKMYFSVVRWCEAILDDECKIPEEVEEIFRLYQEELKEGLTLAPRLSNRLGYDNEAEIRVLCNDKDSFLRLLYYRNRSIRLAQEELGKKAKGRNVVVFGAGNWGIRCYLTLYKILNIDITCFCDNDSSKQGKVVLSKTVMSPQKAFEMYPNALFVIANRVWALDCKRQLMEMGLKENSIDYYQASGKEY